MSTRDQPQAMTERIEPAPIDQVTAQSPLINPVLDSQRFSPRSSNAARHSVELHIDELVLQGFEPAQRYAIGEAIERELTRLLTEHHAPSAITHDLEMAHLDGGTFQIDSDSRPEAIGARVARAIYGGMSQ
jgi:hypothetical protein